MQRPLDLTVPAGDQGQPGRQKAFAEQPDELGHGRVADRETVNEIHSREGFPKFVWTRSSERWLYLKPVI